MLIKLFFFFFYSAHSTTFSSCKNKWTCEMDRYTTTKDGYCLCVSTLLCSLLKLVIVYVVLFYLIGFIVTKLYIPIISVWKTIISTLFRISLNHSIIFTLITSKHHWNVNCWTREIFNPFLHYKRVVHFTHRLKSHMQFLWQFFFFYQ